MLTLIAYTWFGLILGVSFLATPVKFRAPSLTRPVALDVGRTTFHAFGKVEWLFAALLVLAALFDGRSLPGGVLAAVFAVIAAVLFQAVWLIPRLDLRVAAIIDGQEPPPSRLHTSYAVLEGLKALILVGIGIWSAG
ncbi:MAG: DUF4149 domain-containing protein [Actinomycetota bacterium]